ncbi:uncharacterized protein si:ch211-195m9.3 isoform X2 [Notolabrus celidotus]|uniref:uncharacterized protein si:ch211-195m9.3 isoform X2 n=1 Tax=Notolabrus celidotus TaxID=1203425 RepID=UPI00148FC014|nr:uncharacterized protein si:ch211-195m9.3 isoform X2 [Notolabrus celidotus]
MVLFCYLLPVWLTCGIIIVCGIGSDAFKNNCCRKNCMGIEYDTREAVCCENCFHPGRGLSCCGKLSFDPEVATCCPGKPGVTAKVTQGLSQSVSSCCELQAYNSLNEICCQSTVRTKPSANAQCCGRDAIDGDTHLCCGPPDAKKGQLKLSDHHQCCGQDQYDTLKNCCCAINATLQIHPNKASCCVEDSETFDAGTELCCGPPENKTCSRRISDHHLCCGRDQYNTTTHCCCGLDHPLKIHPIGSECCNESDEQPQNPSSQLNSTEPHTGLAGSSCFDLIKCLCGETYRTDSPEPPLCCTPGRHDTPICTPHAGVSCKSGWRPSTDQCCGGTRPNWARCRVRSCDEILYTGREDGDIYLDSSVAYHPAEGTICCSKFHGSSGQHCCGTDIYQPHSEICCNGHRYPKVENLLCCGIKAYNIKSKQKKCCAGRLHHLRSNQSAHEAQCCGSMLQKPSNVCCMSQNEEVLYVPQRGFKCCGHLYYNTSLWSCCAGSLCPVHKPGHHHSQSIKVSECSHVSLNNLDEKELCREMHIGIVDSVSPQSIVFSRVVKIYGKNATVKHLTSPHILETHGCNFLKLICGETYFFNHVNVFTDFNHDYILQSLHFIISKCQATSD